MIFKKILNNAPKNKKEGEMPSIFLTSLFGDEFGSRRLNFF